MNEELSIEVQPRETSGTKASKRLRREGKVPAVVYGGDRPTTPIVIDRRTLIELIKKAGSEHAVFLLKLAGSGTERHCMVHELEVDPTTREIVHVDFLRVDMKEKVRVEVPVELVGVPTGVKNEGGILDFVHREVEVECLPGDIPRHLELDVSALHIGQHVEASQIVVPDSVEMITDPTRTIAAVAAPRIVEEPEEEAEEMLIEAEREEPEIVGRRKAEEEEGEEEG